MTETRTGAEYERCKTAYFTCMDQFCKLKNDDYRRCSCSDRVYDLADARDVLTAAGQELQAFNENLDTVGLTTAQALAMRTESEGEAALAEDKSASKALLQAIMNSIKGEDTTVGGKYSDLNSINLSFDSSGAFGDMDAGATIAMYNGATLYSAVYPQCRKAVRADCNDASLQRAITAYLMAVESDCNTVQSAIASNQKSMKAAVRESSAMLDLARVENRQNHNSADIATCVANVESAVLSEEVCGANYHKCLDNGEFIDVSTGAPITGVTNFYELGNLLTFDTTEDMLDQKLSTIKENQVFVSNFVSRVKKFAQPALDKCVEQADLVWSEYLDRALLDIYYAQQSKVEEIKQGCFDFVSACYVNGDKALTTAMTELMDSDSALVLQPNKVLLSQQMCTDYVASCDNMFGGANSDAGGIVAQYIQNRTDTDVVAACRAVAQQCFDKFGGTGYEKFYYPYSGLYDSSNDVSILDWFTLRDRVDGVDGEYKSPCAQQLATIAACSDADIMKRVFGGFDYQKVQVTANGKTEQVSYYGVFGDDKGQLVSGKTNVYQSDGFQNRGLRSTGVATEVYNQIIDTLSNQCRALQGRFMEVQFILETSYEKDNYCLAAFEGTVANGKFTPYKQDLEGEVLYKDFAQAYGVKRDENMCPRGYHSQVNTQAWGACLCWENGGRRSRDGQSVKCEAVLPVTGTGDIECGQWKDKVWNWDTKVGSIYSSDSFGDTWKPAGWCTMSFTSSLDQVCTKLDEGQTYKLMSKDGKDTDPDNEKIYCPVKIDDAYKGNANLPKGLNI